MKDLIIIPTYNERENIVPLVQEIFRAVPGIFVLVVDDNSPDGTADAVRDMQGAFPNVQVLVREKKEGLGRAYIHAFHVALADESVRNIITMDADFSHQPRYLPEFLKASERYDVVIGSRYVRGGGVEGWELWRRVLSKCANMYCRMITRMPITDCTGGFNLIRASLLRKIDFSGMDSSGYAFLQELKYMLYRAGATFTEVPIIFKNRTMGESKITSHIVWEGVIAPWKMIWKMR
ncbi:MAG: polyprenol monophosphomannose synthase [Candidatus Azambacteria bacterium]|nr:polyprenol monophosphomannose synthase [Candidatus Azambacteria bacterium]